MIRSGYWNGPMTLHGRMAERPQAERIRLGTTFVSTDTNEVFIATAGPRWLPMQSAVASARKAICENCGGPHEAHEARCSWCRRPL